MPSNEPKTRSAKAPSLPGPVMGAGSVDGHGFSDVSDVVSRPASESALTERRGWRHVWTPPVRGGHPAPWTGGERLDVFVLGDPHVRIGGRERPFPQVVPGGCSRPCWSPGVGSSPTTDSSTTSGAKTSPSMRARPCTPPSAGPVGRSARRHAHRAHRRATGLT